MTVEERKREFRSFLIKTKQRKENTVNAYVSGVNTVSGHYGQDVFGIDEIDVLDQLWSDYGLNGQFKDVGDQNSGSTRSGLRDWIEFQKEKKRSDYEEYFSISLTDGALKNGYIVVKNHNGFFPPEFIADKDGISKSEFTLCWPDGDERSTCVLSKFGRIKARFSRRFADYTAPVTLYITKDPNSKDRFYISEQTPTNSMANKDDNQVINNDEFSHKEPLNQILFGPPGTGKTFHTINKALEILDPEYVANNQGNSIEVRRSLKKRFDELVVAQRIRFTTFHQSFSYEDFVEGLKAENDESNGQLRYSVVDGIFKQLSDACLSQVTVESSESIDLVGRKIWKMSLGNTLGEDAYIYDECISQGYALLGYGEQVNFSGCTNRKNIHERFTSEGYELSKDAYAITAVATFLLKIKPGDLVVVTDGNYKFRAIGEFTGEYEALKREDPDEGYGQCRRVKWLRVYEPSLPHEQLMHNTFSQATIYQLRDGSIDTQKLVSLLNDKKSLEDTDATSCKVRDARVLIIDEINRGNISRIFGELITLIEPSKRLGNEEGLEVVLPYSKTRFGIPDNLYIIGTMNTADRSLAGLDIALRRRFTFIEMPPRPELLDDLAVEGINIGQLLRVMNQRITSLLDREHCLGHAYFMSLLDEPTLSLLASIFRQNIIPLLQEYFFEDWERVCWVLNDQSKPDFCSFVVVDNSVNQSYLFPGVHDRLRHSQVWQLNDDAFNLVESYQGIIEVTTTRVEQESLN